MIICDTDTRKWLLYITNGPHSWAANYHVLDLAHIVNIMGVTKFWKLSTYEIFTASRVASPDGSKFIFIIPLSHIIEEFW